jgi:hypothetical protein
VKKHHVMQCFQAFQNREFNKAGAVTAPDMKILSVFVYGF